MRPLVYDFGRLNDNTEEGYIHQIVKGRCEEISLLNGNVAIYPAVAIVLTWSQAYMRIRSVSIDLKLIVYHYFDT